MSYHANVNLTCDSPDADWSDIVARFAEIDNPDNPQYGFTEERLTGTYARWDETTEDHLGQLSAHFPDVLFTLACFGEDGNAWVVYAQNGLHYSVDCIPPPFNPDCLRHPPREGTPDFAHGGMTIRQHVIAELWNSQNTTEPWDSLDTIRREEVAQHVLAFVEAQLANSLEIP